MLDPATCQCLAVGDDLAQNSAPRSFTQRQFTNPPKLMRLNVSRSTGAKAAKRAPVRRVRGTIDMTEKTHSVNLVKTITTL